MNQNSNPVFRKLESSVQSSHVDVGVASASWRGIISKTLMLVLVALVAGFGVLFLPFNYVVIPLLIIGPIASLFLVIFAMRNPARARGLSIFYALFQGITYGAITWLIESVLPGVGGIALGITFGIVLIMAVLHSIGAVRATPRLVRFVMSSLITIIIVSLIMLIINFAAPVFASTFYDNYPLMVIVGSFLVLLGAFMLIIDFDNAKRLVESGAPKVYEWQVSLGIMVTVVWIYLRVLRLLVIILGNRK